MRDWIGHVLGSRLMTTGNVEQSEFWERRAADWIAGTQYTDIVTGSFGVDALERLALAPGQRVIDIGCGTGATTVELARRVVPAGEALGIDISPTLVAASKATASNASVDNISFRVADAQVDSLGDRDVDAVYSRFGVMFFADPVAAFANIRNALRPDGEIGFACWQSVFDNEWMLVPGGAAMSVTGTPPPMPGPGEPGPFSLADADHLASVLTDAGFRDVEITSALHPVSLPAAQLDLLASSSQQVGAVREVLKTADVETTSRIEGAIRDALSARIQDGVISLSAAAHIVHARA